MRLGLTITLLVVAGCGAETPRSETREGRPVAAPFVEIVCTKDGDTRLWTPVVEVQPDGVHLDIENRAGGQASIDDFPLDVGKGRHKEVVTASPGRMKVACNPFSQHGSGIKPVRYDLRLVDPEGHWISTELECETDMVIGSTQYASPSSDQDPIAIVEESVNGLEPDDVVEVAGYPKAAVPSVRILRAGQVIGVASFLEADDGGLAIEGTSLCASEGLRW